MNGTDHYKAAERCISQAYDASMDGDAQFHLAEAQAHATLALAAATALTAVTSNTMSAGAPVNQLAYDTETIAAVNAWHETATR